MNFFYSTLIVFFIISIACSNQNNKNAKNISYAEKNNIAKSCIALNDSAVNLLNKYYVEDSNPAKLDIILDLLNESISCDTNFYLAYNNKITVLSLKGEYLKVVNLLNKMLEFSNNNPQLIFFKGMAYEKLKDYPSAEIAYKQAAVEYEKRLQLHPDSLIIITDKLFFTAFTEGKDQAIAELKEYVLKYPNNTMLKEYQFIFETYHRDDFMFQHGK
ncbi:tetratricopeptide repeat protein [Labilibaculum sp. K2S]|uniref:tetratricopeptide repeat protein n=1 Tax=Labilibaculum sp. K2S TaxID=3056386 RepID=UPI0025A3BBBE|nr:hypothetical protein [Labilibaculum sp. K2S]